MLQKDAKSARLPRSRFLIAIMLIGMLAGVGGFWFWIRPTLLADFIDRTVAQANDALQRADFEDAGRLARQVLRYQPDHPKAMLVAARVAAARSDWSTAWALCDRLGARDKRSAAQRLFTAGEAAVRVGQARRAEELLQLTLHLQPTNVEAMYILAFVLGAEGRAWEAAPLVRVLVENNRFDAPQLLLVGGTDKFYIDKPQFVTQCRQAVPDDPIPLLATARNSLLTNDLSTTEKYLREIIAHDPTLIEAQARLGRLLVDSGRDDELRAWHEALPINASQHPEVWVTRGLYALRHQQDQAAIRCFGEAARLDPNLLIANLHLGRLLTVVGQAELAAEFQDRAALLSELLVPLTTFMRSVDPLLVRRVVELCERLGRPRESVAWAELLLRTAPGTDWAVEQVSRVSGQYSGGPPWLVPAARLADRMMLTTFPDVKWGDQSSPRDTRGATEQATSEPPFQFSEDASRLGIQFQYYNDAASPENSLRMLEFTGGGIGIIDFDVDGWPDLYAAQGAVFPGQQDAPVHLDRLFRNRGGVRFDDVTDACGLREFRYSQGVSVGDYDQDGFPDLYVANIGSNRLFRNNGDGTFDDVTEAAGLRGDAWTTSCCLADLNGDGWPDLYAVNYLTGKDVYTRVCGSETQPKACLPANFDPLQDAVWVNLGDGRFEEQTRSALITEQYAGRGLGILVASLDDPSRPDLFVANDTDPNFWYVNRTETRGGPLRFDEAGALSGLAFDADGQSQACMGIAAGDVNRDGRLDLFVTNFYREANTLYLQQPDRTFVDATRAAGLYEPSLLMLGFGTQFLDADADGWLDLVLTNGHVYNNSSLGEPWQMRPQVFRNVAGRFQELPANQIGPYFQGKYIGRALARWDWNRDGRPDFAVSHLDVPLAVLTNQTPTDNRTLVLTLRGVQSNREAIGSLISVKAGNERWSVTVSAGDGYLVSNDRRLTIGIGAADQIDELTIRWPAGRVDTFQNVTLENEHLVVEGGGLWSIQRN